MNEMVKHGQMRFVGFDSERYVLFECDQCSRKIALHPGTGKRKSLDQGILLAQHSAIISPALFSADVYRELWGIEIPDGLTGNEISLEVRGITVAQNENQTLTD